MINSEICCCEKDAWLNPSLPVKITGAFLFACVADDFRIYQPVGDDNVCFRQSFLQFDGDKLSVARARLRL